jgi:DHA2 family multidrug resistance protein
LTTLTLDGIPPVAMGNATSLYNLIRNLGGSFGIATSATLLSRYAQVNMARLSEHVSIYDQPSMTMLRQLTQGFIARGSDVATAQQQALAGLYGMTAREASALTFIQIFRLLGLVCLAMLPLIFILRRPEHSTSAPHVIAE